MSPRKSASDARTRAPVAKKSTRNDTAQDTGIENTSDGSSIPHPRAQRASTRAKSTTGETASPRPAAAPPARTPPASTGTAPAPANRTEILRRLSELYPSPRTELDHENPWQLLIATILSAQSTDKGVNQVTPALFAAFPDAHAMAKAEPEALEPYISRLGLYHNKAKSIAATARMLAELYEGQVPRTMEELTALPGVGRKTANVVMSNAYGIPAIAVDTHVFRVSNRLGLAQSPSVDEVEEQLMKAIPRENWTDAHHWLILHGRRVCAARNPACDRCVLSELCPSSTQKG